MVAEQKPQDAAIDDMLRRFRLASSILAEAEAYQQRGDLDMVYQKIMESRQALIGEQA